MGRIGAVEIFFIVLIVILLFGAKKLPEIGKALGKAIREFRKEGSHDPDMKNDSADKGDEQKG